MSMGSKWFAKKMVKPMTTSIIGDAIAQTAAAEVGVREVPPDSNRGERVEAYMRSTWMDSIGGWPWCAAFCCWVIEQVGERHPLPVKRPQTAGAWDYERWARKVGADLVKPPTLDDLQPGDIITFTFSHIGIVESVIGNVITTIEGNTDASGSREGGGVYRKRRRISQVRARIRI